VCPNLLQQKNPKVLTEVLKWIEITIPDFGVASIKARDLINFLKAMLENANPGVRKGAIEVLVILRIQIGPSISSLVEDLKPALLSTINTEFEKVAGQTAPVPTKGPAKGDGSSGEGGGSGSATQDFVLDDIFPRVDISARIAPVVVVL
jgi:cytoskeleton-associated protein 5